MAMGYFFLNNLIGTDEIFQTSNPGLKLPENKIKKIKRIILVALYEENRTFA